MLGDMHITSLHIGVWAILARGTEPGETRRGLPGRSGRCAQPRDSGCVPARVWHSVIRPRCAGRGHRSGSTASSRPC